MYDGRTPAPAEKLVVGRPLGEETRGHSERNLFGRSAYSELTRAGGQEYSIWKCWHGFRRFEFNVEPEETDE